ncbi:MAG: hypothetical protein K8R36_19600 [Planctomycetales bacterium]|nr:hypothetical protein [Planctomycetales bacterium]
MDTTMFLLAQAAPKESMLAAALKWIGPRVLIFSCGGALLLFVIVVLMLVLSAASKRKE